MTIQEVHYQFKLNLDRVDSLANPDFNPAEIDFFLNEAQLIFVKQRMGTTNAKRSGFETSQKRIDDLGNLVVKFPLQPYIVPVLVSPGVYEVDTTTTTLQYLYLINAYAIVQKEDCEIRIPLKFVQHDDINDALRDPFNKDSKEFIPYNVGRNSANTGTSLYIYSTQNIIGVSLEYVKYPKRVSFGNYTYLDGVLYPPSSFETSEQTHREIIDIACQLAAQSAFNPQYVSVTDKKTVMNE